MNGEYVALAGSIRRTLADVERVVQRAETMWEKARTTGDDGYWDALALNLHGFYAGLERQFEQIASALERFAPKGSHWHQELLAQMTVKMPDVRPPVISLETYRCLDEYREFRHIVRNVYTFRLRPSRLDELARELRPCLESAARELKQFAALLEYIAREDKD